MDILTELNAQAERLINELRKARKLAKEEKGGRSAYQHGRAVELENWLHSVEGMITKIIESRTAKNGKQ